MIDVDAGRRCPECSESCSGDAQFCSRCGFPVGAVSRVDRDPLVGRELPGSYHVLELIGTGGMGRVYRAQQKALGRTVAIKVIHPHLLAEEKSLARFLTEARATSQLNHPNTVSVIDFGQTDDGQPYLVMEFLRGQNLAQVVAIEGLLPLPRLLGILRQVLLALGEAHAIDIIHRDLKPENIIVEPLRHGGDLVKVVDFGLAKLKADEGHGITMPGIVCGTPDFMAPEQGRGDPIDGRSDLYAVGVVMFWLLCGRLPFEASTPTQVVMMHITMPVPDPRDIAPKRKIPDAVLSVLYRALAKSRTDRYPDAHSFADAIQELSKLLERPSLAPKGFGLWAGAPHLPSLSVVCSSCNLKVPWGRFCLTCGAELPAPPEPEPPSIAGARVPFTGREEELRWLGELAQRGRSGFLLARLVGDNGTGKTRLVEELDARKQGVSVVRASPDPHWAEIAGFTLGALVLELLGARDLPEIEAAPETPLKRVLLELLQGENADSLAPSTRRGAYRDALGFALDKAARRSESPLLVFIDDFDRVDGVTRQAVTDLASAGHRPRVAVLLAHSHRFHSRVLATVTDAELVRVLVGLPLNLAADLLRRELQGRLELPLSSAGTGTIAPLYLRQVVRFALDGGTNPPSKLADLIAYQVSALEGTQRTVAQAIAVLGDKVSIQLLAGFVHLEADGDEACRQAVNALVEAGIAQSHDEQGISLAHPMFHDVVLLTTPAEARRDLHRRARRLFSTVGAPVEVLAEHAFLAQEAMPALIHLEQAADKALARGDAESATNLLQRGLDLARLEIHRGEIEDPLSAVVIFGRKLSETLQSRGRLSDARGVLQEVLGATAPRGTHRAEVLAQLAEIAQRNNQLAEAERLLERALAAARDARAPEGLILGLELRLHSVRSSSGPSA
jgi:serine/threonine protein kinase